MTPVLFTELAVSAVERVTRLTVKRPFFVCVHITVLDACRNVIRGCHNNNVVVLGHLHPLMCSHTVVTKVFITVIALAIGQSAFLAASAPVLVLLLRRLLVFVPVDKVVHHHLVLAGGRLAYGAGHLGSHLYLVSIIVKTHNVTFITVSN